MSSRIIFLGLLAVPTGCGVIQRTTPPAPAVAGMYSGRLMIEAQELTAELHVVAEGSRFRIEFATGDGVRASGKGTLRGGTLHAGLDYDHGCQGRMMFSGHASADGSTLTGSVLVSDCTGRVAGSFEFGRRVAAAHWR